MSLETGTTLNSLINLETIKLKKVNLAIFGHGNVGGVLIDQIVQKQSDISKRRQIQLNIFAIANSTTVLLDKTGIAENWRAEKANEALPFSLEQVIEYAKKHSLENLILVDNTASDTFVAHYSTFVKHKFHLISSNKISNTQSLQQYDELRAQLRIHEKQYLYETNVGAGLPLIDTIKMLHHSGENITRIRGVFSGSLSYIFNIFSESNESFSTVLLRAIESGYTEPDAREDLSGNDVGRKLLILARELDLHCELEDVTIQNLVPKELRKLTGKQFLEQVSSLDVAYHIKKKNLKKDKVLRYVADLHGDLSKDDGAVMNVSLQPVAKNSMIGQLKGSDSIFEIYTESYGANPIVIQGAGAGATVTARGVFGDILRLSEKLN